VLNGEHFAMMAGAGFEAEMIAEVGGQAKERLGKLSYLKAAVRHVGGPLVPMKIKIDDATWFDGRASCLLLGNVGTIAGGIEAFDDARPDDGCWRWASSPPAGRSSGRGCSARWPQDAPRTRRSSGSPAPGRCPLLAM
jgi:diacylglycerol kinase family enzyme